MVTIRLDHRTDGLAIADPALVLGPAWPSGTDPEVFANEHAVQRILELVTPGAPADAGKAWWFADDMTQAHLALDADGGPLSVGRAVKGWLRRSLRYTGPTEVFSPEMWNSHAAALGTVAVLDASVVDGEVVWLGMMLTEEFDEDLDRFRRDHVDPLVDRLAADGPHVDGWWEEDNGHLRLTLEKS